MSFVPALWIAIFLLRALGNRNNQQQPASGGNWQENVDGVVVLVLIVKGIVLSMLYALLGPGWLAFFFSAWLVALAPHWTAWRVCQPLGLRGAGVFFVTFVARGPLVREGRRRLFEWSLRGGPARDALAEELPATLRRSTRAESELLPADGWTTCAAALRAESAGDVAHADRLARGLTELPTRPRLPRVVARVGFELLAFAALRRGDMPAVLQRASLGRGRGCRFLRLLARARVVGDVPAPWLWIAWALAPRRRHTLAAVRDALRSSAPGREWAEAREARSPWGFHLRTLERAAGGERIERARVMRLARLWDGPLGAEGQARLRARALELGVLDPETAARMVYTDVLEDLDALAAVAVGAWPQDDVEPEGLSGLMLAEAENRLYGSLEPWVEPYRDGVATKVHYPLAEWDRWLAFRAAIDRLEEALGEEALATSWYGGLRLAAWNWPCRVLNLHQQKAAWICHVMFEWTASLAERIGDEEAASVNRENAAAAARIMPR